MLSIGKMGEEYMGCTLSYISYNIYSYIVYNYFQNFKVIFSKKNYKMDITFQGKMQSYHENLQSFLQSNSVISALHPFQITKQV